MPPVAPKSFTEYFYSDVMASDLALFSDSDRERIAASIWALARERKGGHLKLRLFNPSPECDGWTVDHTVLETVTDDMPFLVDSVTGALQRMGLTVHLVIHPVLLVSRQADGAITDAVGNVNRSAALQGKQGAGHDWIESYIHIQFDRCLDEAFLKEIEAEVRAVFADVRAAVEDWQLMRRRLRDTVEQIRPANEPSPGAEEEAVEVRDFLTWLDDNNFTFLGCRDIDLVHDRKKIVSIKILPESGLGILRDPDIRMFGGQRDLDGGKSMARQMYLQHLHLMAVTKTNEASRVHRLVPMDAIFVRHYDSEGSISGERLFVGLFTSQSYSQNPREVPFLRRKIENVTGRAGFRPGSHDSRVFVHILNTYPRDELFQIEEDELYDNARGILQLQERARVALIVRRDSFGRYLTCLIYVPRDRYDLALRNKFRVLLESALGGQSDGWQVRIDDSIMARVFVVIRLDPTVPYKEPDLAKLESDLRELCRAWSDRLRDSLAAIHGEAAALALLRRYGDAFPVTYRESIEPASAVHDIASLERGKASQHEELIVDVAPPVTAEGLWHLKLMQAERPIALSEVLPLVENAGFKVAYMGGPYEVQPRDSAKSVFIHEFVGKPAHQPIVPSVHIKPMFEETFGKIWTGELDNDPFNALTVRAGLGWRDVVLLRAFARYLRQLRIPYSHEMMAATFVTHPDVARHICGLFHARHNPDLKGNRTAMAREIEAMINEELAKVDTLEDDRIIRRYVNLVQSCLRTNFFQTDKAGASKSYVSFKFDSHALDFMPLPKPLYEIFVYSTRVEAVHLRGGKVARGGIRWSDRRDDFRNEILGLMKAQMVKNSVIVPVGSKGGFIVKRPPAEADKLQAEGIECYRTMMRGMLDITDNRMGNAIVPPPRVLRHDGDDPYLVVAADKGTAKFSDIANGISQDYGFWLDDAFASGGSAGYDHKGMGITARGAWEAVKRHFREMGKDIQTTDFTCVGVGDMSGDVFGNGMLLSKHTLLLGAFDHRHIFCDPNPDAATSFTERKRMFDMPRSSWADYDRKKISKGGGVFSRAEKSIRLSPEMKKAYGVAADSLPPAELIQAMLKANVELLYFGGIGTYVKASSESHEQAGDHASDCLRVDAGDLRAKVIGEGANLACTQRGRIEFALRGGRVNTDAIDNSAGVSTSDHEVNIKILLRRAVDKKGMTIPARNKLLGSMTDEVARLVLRDNYKQTQSLSAAEAEAPELLPLHVRAMHLLEQSGLLNPAVEFLPDSNGLAERQRMGKGLTRPELAVLLAYAKIQLYQQLLDSRLPDDDACQTELVHYFPEALQRAHMDDIRKHQLGREIIATAITNSIVNRCGSYFVLTMTDRTGKDSVAVTRAYLLARDAFGMRELWQSIEALDNRVPAAVQTQMHIVMQRTLHEAVHWFLVNLDLAPRLAPLIVSYGKGVEGLAAWLEKSPPEINGMYKKVEDGLVAQGVPHALARRVAIMPALATALDLSRLADMTGGTIDGAAEVFFGLGQRLGFDWLASRARALVLQSPWQREAISAILDDLAETQRRLTALVVGQGKGNSRIAKGQKPLQPRQRLSEWLEKSSSALLRYEAMLAEWQSIGAVDMAVLTLANRQLGRVK